MALRNRCCAEEETKHKHDFDWLLEAITKVTIYCWGKKPNKQFEKQKGEISLKPISPSICYVHVTNCEDQAGGLGCTALFYSPPSPSHSPSPPSPSPLILPLSSLLSPPQKSQECVKHLVQNHSIPINCQSSSGGHR